MSPRWEPLWIDGAYSPSLRERANGAAGVYAIRSKATHEVQYVGESSTGNLWRTLLRHFQDSTGSFAELRETFTGSAPHYEVAIHVTTPGNGRRKPPKGSKRPRPFSSGGGDPKAMAKQAEWIATLHPVKNRDDGKKAAEKPEPAQVECPECHGRGEDFMGDRCDVCRGSGRVRADNPGTAWVIFTSGDDEYAAGPFAVALRKAKEVAERKGEMVTLALEHDADDLGWRVSPSAAQLAPYRTPKRTATRNPAPTILDVESSWQALLGEDVSPKISTTRANRAKRISAEIRGYYRGEAGARLVTFDGAGEESHDEKELIAWAAKAFGALYTFRQTDRGRLIPGPTAHSSEVAAFWLALIGALPAVYLPLLPRPWVSEPDRGVVEGMPAALVYYSPKGGRPEVVGHTVSERIGERVALLAELTDYAWILKGLGKKPTPAAAVARAELEGDPRERARCIKLASWLGAAFPDAVAPKPKREPKPKAAAKPKPARPSCGSCGDKLDMRVGYSHNADGSGHECQKCTRAKAPARYYAELLDAIEAGPAHSLAVTEVSDNEHREVVPKLLATGAIARLPARGRWPERFVVTGRGSHELGSFDSDDRSFHDDSIDANNDARRKRLAREAARASVAPSVAPASKPAGYGVEESGKRKAGQLRMFNPGKPPKSYAGGLAKPRGALVQLGLLTELETARGRFAWSLKDAPILANDSAGRLFIVYPGSIVRSSSAEEIKRYRSTHWGKSGAGKVRAGGVAVGPFKSHGAAVSVTYTTAKGIDRGLVDYVHPFGEGGPREWKPPTLVEHVCQRCGPKCAAEGALGLVGGTYRVTDRGIVG